MQESWTVIAIITLLLLFAIGLQYREHRRNNGNTTSNNSKPTKKSESAALHQTPQENDYPSEAAHRAAEQRNWTRQIIVEGATLLLAAIAAVGAIWTGIETWSQAQAAWTAVGEAHQQTIDANAALRASERPWVSVEGVKFISFTSLGDGNNITLTKDTPPGQPIQIQLGVTFQNTGPSTATDAIYSTSSNLDQRVDESACKGALAASANFDKFGQIDRGFALVPGQSVTTQQGLWPPKSGLLYGDMLGPDGGLQVFVCVAYKDQFLIQHHTQDCFVSQPMNSGGTPIFIPCEQGDEAD